ncbi:unnamed protein product [Heterobilharzia americana]|nr:unnamed protein product [Heterobilharzia americana]
MHNNKPGGNITSELDKRRKAYRRCYSIQPEFSSRFKQIHPVGNVMPKSQSKLLENEFCISLEPQQQIRSQLAQQQQLRQKTSGIDYQYNPGHSNSQLSDTRKSFCSPSSAHCREVKSIHFAHSIARSFDAGANEGCQFRYEEHRGSNLVLQHITGRRGSFLYRQETNSGHSYYSSRHESITGDEIGRQFVSIVSQSNYIHLRIFMIFVLHI